MSGMFNNCISLNNINLVSFNTINVTNMSAMFSGCHSLRELNLSNFNTINVTNMNMMFKDCFYLTNLNIMNFDSHNIKSLNKDKMFDNCISLKKQNIQIKNRKMIKHFKTK